MGTIDISYLSLGIGLLLLSIPLFYIWKFKTGLLRATLIGTARMIVQLFFIGIYLKYLFLWNNPWINFLWVIVMILVASQTALARTQLILHPYFRHTDGKYAIQQCYSPEYLL